MVFDLGPSLCRLFIFIFNSALSSHLVASQFKRDTFEKVLFFATAQICIIFLISLTIECYNAIVQTMQREQYFNVMQDNDAMSLGDLELHATEDEPTIPTQEEIVVQTPIENAVVFRTSEKLRAYIWLTHKTGVMLFILIICMDYSHHWMTYVFLVGLSLRSILTSLKIERDRVCFSLFRMIALAVLSLSYVWLAYITEFPLPIFQDFPLTSPIIMLFLFVSGIQWAHTSAFQDRPITEICLDAKFTVLFISVPTFIILYRASLFDDYSPTIKDVILLWVIQPTVKFLCIVIFVMSIRAGRLLELVFVNSITLMVNALMGLENTDEKAQDRLMCIVLISILFGFYVTRIIYNAL